MAAAFITAGRPSAPVEDHSRSSAGPLDPTGETPASLASERCVVAAARGPTWGDGLNVHGVSVAVVDRVHR